MPYSEAVKSNINVYEPKSERAFSKNVFFWRFYLSTRFTLDAFQRRTFNQSLNFECVLLQSSISFFQFLKKNIFRSDLLAKENLSSTFNEL